MSTPPAPVRRAEAQGERVARSDTFEWLARAGLLARGVVYAVVGVLALKLALGVGGKTTSQQGALQTIAKEPFGQILLVLLAFGLAGYAVWRLLRAALGHGPEADDDTKERLAGLESGIAYAALCATAIKILLGSGGGGGSPDKTTGGVLGWPAGRYLVIAAGLVIIGVGAEQAYKGVTKKFLEKSKTGEMGPRMRPLFTVAGVLGHLARAVIFALIGYFLIRAAIDFDPKKSVGLDGALTALGHSPYGPVLLGIVAFGLIWFAFYSALDARYRKV